MEESVQVKWKKTKSSIQKEAFLRCEVRTCRAVEREKHFTWRMGTERLGKKVVQSKECDDLFRKLSAAVMVSCEGRQH